MLSFVFFFFSSRRRHTRCSRDWSSDVCSSDLGCLFCKRVLADNMIAALTPIRERAQALRAEPLSVSATLRAGAAKARVLARETMTQVRRCMGLLEAGEA